MTKEERLSLLGKNPVFWSRLGFCYDPPLKNAEGRPLVFTEDLSRYGKYHEEFCRVGVHIHTCVLHAGWMGVDEYDYSLTDRVLDEIFRCDPDGYFIPRRSMVARLSRPTIAATSIPPFRTNFSLYSD